MIYWLLYKSTLPTGTCTSYGTDDFMVKKICTQGEDIPFAGGPDLWDPRGPLTKPKVLECSADMKIDHFELKAIFLTIDDAHNYSLFLRKPFYILSSQFNVSKKQFK